jgi:two-component system phosphate regulon response regulator PhoB
MLAPKQGGLDMRTVLSSPTQSSAILGQRPLKSRSNYVLVVEDEADLAELLRFNLKREGYTCHCVDAGDAALRAIRDRTPDLILLDRMLPGLSGDEVVSRVKRDPATAGIPIIVLTAKAEEEDELVGFALGADDYVTKPFSMKVLLARMAAMLRRAEALEVDPDVVAVGPVVLNPARHEVTVNGQRVVLTATEFKLLRVLLSAHGRVLDREGLIDAVLGSTAVVTNRTIDVHITALRKKLGAAAAWIQTVRGVGYTLRPPD